MIRIPRAIQPIFRGNKAIIGFDRDAEIVTRFDLRECLAFLVQDIECHRGWNMHGDLGGPFANALFFDCAQDVQCGRLDRPHMARTTASRACVTGCFR